MQLLCGPVLRVGSNDRLGKKEHDCTMQVKRGGAAARLFQALCSYRICIFLSFSGRKKMKERKKNVREGGVNWEKRPRAIVVPGGRPT